MRKSIHLTLLLISTLFTIHAIAQGTYNDPILVTKTTDESPFLTREVVRGNNTTPADVALVTGTLQWAIRKANADRGADHIIFSENLQIELNRSLPRITEELYIDGTSHAGYEEHLQTVKIEYSTAALGRRGTQELLRFGKANNGGRNSDKSIVSGLHLTNSNRNGINLTEVNDIQIINNVITRGNRASRFDAGIFIIEDNRGTTIQNNLIGTDLSESPNQGFDRGIYMLTNVGRYINSIQIGGDEPGQGNTIANNTRGIDLSELPSSGVDNITISQNRLINNETAISFNFSFSSPNGNKLIPVITNVTGTGEVNGIAEAGDIIELFGSTGSENANEYLTTITADAAGNWNVNLGFLDYPFIVVTATDAIGSNAPELENTSPLSNAVAYPILCDSFIVELGPKQTITPGESIPIGITGQNRITYSWSPTTNLDNPNIANPTVFPTETTTYTLTATSSNGCEAVDSVDIIVCTPKDLSGILTIGGENPDYATIAEALSDLTCGTVIDTLTYLLRAGIYNEGIDLSSSITIQRTTSEIPISFIVIIEDEEEVTLLGSNTLIQIEDKTNINLFGLTLQPNSTSPIATIQITNSNNISLNELIISPLAEHPLAIQLKNNTNTDVIGNTINNYAEGLQLENEANAYITLNQINTRNTAFSSNQTNNLRIEENAITVTGNQEALTLSNGEGVQLLFNNTITSQADGLHLEGSANFTSINSNTINVINRAIQLDCLNDTIEIVNNQITNSMTGIQLATDTLCAPTTTGLLYFNQNQITNTQVGIQIQESNQGAYIIRNNDINTTQEAVNLNNLGNAVEVGMVGNLLRSAQQTITTNNSQATLQLRFNTIITKGLPEFNTVEITNTDYIDFCSNLIINETGNQAVNFIGAAPATVLSSRNNFYSRINPIISNNEPLLLTPSNTKIDPRFNEDGITLSTRSTLLNDTLPCQDSLSIIDLRGNIRVGAIDIGAIESENTPSDGIDITFILENGSFTPNASTFNQFEIQGLENFSEVELNIYNANNTLVYTSTSTTEFWQGTDINTGDLVPAGLYIYNLNLDGKTLSGIVVVNE